jgi:uncharacterized protein
MHPPQCVECQWLHLCRGGCQKHRLITSDTVASPTYFCEAYRRFFQHSRRRLRRMADEVTGGTQGTGGRGRGTAKARPTENAARNDPCPCGSGRKYKHCCLGKPTGAATKGEDAKT